MIESNKEQHIKNMDELKQYKMQKSLHLHKLGKDRYNELIKEGFKPENALLLSNAGM
jgi:hypothetical protein